MCNDEELRISCICYHLQVTYSLKLLYDTIKDMYVISLFYLQVVVHLSVHIQYHNVLHCSLYITWEVYIIYVKKKVYVTTVFRQIRNSGYI